MGLAVAFGDIVRALASSIWRIVFFGSVGFVGLAAISFASDDPLTTFFQLLSYVGIATTVVAALAMLLTFRTARAIAPPALAAAMATTVLTAAISVWLSSGRPTWAIASAALALGALVGAYWSSTLSLEVDGANVRARGTLWYLAIWAIAFACNQLVANAGGAAPDIGALALLFSSGLSLGASSWLIRRVQRASRSV